MSNTYSHMINGTPVDVYDILRAFGVTDPALQHAIKKLLRNGTGEKSLFRDVAEAKQCLIRWEQTVRVDYSEQINQSRPGIATGVAAAGSLRSSHLGARDIINPERSKHDY